MIPAPTPVVVTELSADGLAALAADVLTDRGGAWTTAAPLMPQPPGGAVGRHWNEVAMLRRIGALTATPEGRWPGQATSEGVAFTHTTLDS